MRKTSINGKLGVFRHRTYKLSTFSQKRLKWAILSVILAFLSLSNQSCKTQPPVIIQKEEINWVYKDSINIIDSICYIPIERYMDIVPIYDTLVLENSLSLSRSWVDTSNHTLRGELKNKNAIQYQIKYVERLVTNDSIVEREVPVPYEVVKTKTPKWAWVSLIIWVVISLVVLGVLVSKVGQRHF